PAVRGREVGGPVLRGPPGGRADRRGPRVPHEQRRGSMSRTPGAGLMVLAPLGFEARAVRRGLPPPGIDVRIERTGRGPRRARAAARRAATIPSRAVAVAGVCGALDPTLRPGDVVVATEIRGPDGTTVLPGAGILLAAVRTL